MDKLLVSVTEAAEMLSISRGTAYKMIRRQELPRLKVGAFWKVPVEGLKKWIAEHELEVKG